MATLFQGFHKDESSALQSPNRAELLCRVLANGWERRALGRTPSCLAASGCWSGSLGSAVSWPMPTPGFFLCEMMDYSTSSGFVSPVFHFNNTLK